MKTKFYCWQINFYVNIFRCKVSTTCSMKNVKISKRQHDSLRRRAMKINEGIDEVGKVVRRTRSFDEKLRRDKYKIKDIDARVII